MTTVPLSTRAGASLSAWSRRPVLSWVVRLASVVVPVVGSFAVAWLLTRASPDPDTWQRGLARWVLIALLSTVVLIGLERWTRRLMPVAALLDLTLAFPDRAPSRFRVALRTGTTGQLRRRIEEIRSGAPTDPSVSAGQRVLELVAALSVHDRITRGHSERVRAYAQMIAQEMRLDAEELDRLRWAALLHDVGKLLVPTSILNKDGGLTDAEFAIIKTHPENGRRIVEELVPWLGESARAVWEHHEKWDGSGYPHGLAGTDISLAARIVAVADVYDVMTSVRSYKSAVSATAAREELARCAGTHFDPEVVRAFLNVSLGRVRRTAGPLSWASQLTLFPTAVFGSAQAAGSAAVLTGALSASTVGIGAGLASDTWAALDPRDVPDALGRPRQVDAADEIEIVGAQTTIVTVPPTSAPMTIRIVGPASTTTLPRVVAPLDPPATPPPSPTGAATATAGAPADGSPTGTIVVTTTPPATVVAATETTTVATAPSTTLPATAPPAPLPSTTSPATTLPSTTSAAAPPPSTTLPATPPPSTTLPATTLPSTTLPVTTLPATPPAIPAGGSAGRGGQDGTTPPSAPLPGGSGSGTPSQPTGPGPAGRSGPVAPRR